MPQRTINSRLPRGKAPSSRGQGHRPLTAKTRVRIPVGSLPNPLFGGLILCQKENRTPCSHRRASKRLGQGVRLEGHPRPEYERQHEEEDEA
jgi:hypothetical protein